MTTTRSTRRNPMTAIRTAKRQLLDRLQGRGVVNGRGKGVVGLIDVGSVGKLPEPWFTQAGLLSHVLKFEPRDPRGAKSNVVTFDAALWGEAAILPFYVYKGNAGQGSSLYPQNFQYVRDNFESLRKLGPPDLAETWFERSELDHVEELSCVTLDEVLSKRAETYHVLKIDAQGAELEILKGARHYLSTPDCLALHLELFNIPLYEGIALRPEVEDWLDRQGFGLVKEYPPHGSFDSQNDCVFLRREASGPVVDTIRRTYGL